MSYLAYRWQTFGLAFGGTFAAVGVTAGLGALEAADHFTPSLASDGRVAAGWLIAAVVVSAAVGVVRVRRLQSVRVHVRKEYDVRVVVDNFMANLARFPDANCVFGVNDRLSVDDLRPDSIHQLFLDAHFAELSSPERQTVIDEAMAQSRVAARRTKEERDRVPPGSVVCLEFGEPGPRRLAFLLANSTQVRPGHYGGIGATRQAISAVWRQHDELGVTSRELLFPLVGTGPSDEMTRMYSIYRIVDEYFDHLEEPGRTQLRVKRLVVSVLPHALRDGEVDLAAVHGYVRARAKLHDAMFRA